MHPAIVVVIPCVAIATLLILWKRWKGIARRPKIPFSQYYAECRLDEIIDLENFIVVMDLVGRAYGFHPGKMRVTDSFSGNLATADAMLPDDSRDILWTSLIAKYPFMSVETRFETVRDVMVEVGKRTQSDGSSGTRGHH